MNGSFDYKKYAILYVDDEEKSLKMFAQAFENVFRIYTAPNAAEGFRVLEEHAEEIGVLISDLLLLWLDPRIRFEEGSR